MDKKNKIIVISGISVASITLLATIISAFHTPKAPDPKELGPRKKVSYMASKQFASLPEEEKTAYIKKLGRSSMKEYRKLSSTERKALMKNTMKAKFSMHKERINKFFKMSEEEQNKHLDEIIAKQSAMWKKYKKRRKRQVTKNKSSNQKKAAKKSSNANINAIKQYFIENTDSTSRAQLVEYWRRMQARRKQTQRK